MTCDNCGSHNEPGRKFCGECGSRLTAVCATCGAANTPTARFCGDCGTPMTVGTATPTAATPAATRAELAAPVAERRVVTVLFADLVGFTTLSEGRDAEAVRDLLTQYFDLCGDVIGRYGGTIEKFIGDAVMAVWGAPVAHEDDAERGVRAGLELVDAIRGLGAGIQARAGVLTGEAAVTLGAVNQGMVAGDLVNTASRLQSVAAPGTVLVGEATQRAASGAVAFEPAGEHILKGKEAPVAAWVATRVVSKRKGLGRSDRLEAPFVGREAELRLLKDVFHAISGESRSRLVSITGQAGIGKTRLAWEFLKYVDGVVEGVWWHDGRSPAYGEGVTFWALGEMVRYRAGLAETDDAATTRVKVAEMVATHVPDEAERRWIEPALLTLLGVADAPAGGRDELFRAWRTFFERMASTGTVTLLFEDLQWADAGLLDFIDHLLEWSRGVPILIMTLARPELLDRRPDWGAGRRNFLALGLEPLSESAMRELLAGLVPGLPAPALRSIVARAGGIPLYAVETVRMLVSEGRLTEVDGRYEPVGELGELAVPETLQALIAARLDGLDPTDRTLLQDAAVLGLSFTVAGLAAVSGEEPRELERRLRAMERAELVVQEVDPRSPERGMYAFVQALIREVAYGTLAKRDRRARHLAAARFFEGLGDEELAGALATHYMAAWLAAPDGPEGKAIGIQARLALLGAADRAMNLGSPESAIGFLEQALQVETEPSERAPILERAGAAAGNALQPARAEVFLREAIEIRRELDDAPAMYHAIGMLAAALISGRRLEDAAALVEPIIPEASGVAHDSDFAAFLTSLARIRSSQDREDETAALLERALPLAERDELADVLVGGLLIKGNMLTKAGRSVEGTALLEAARRVAIDTHQPDREVRALVPLSYNTGLRDPRAAVQLEREGIEIARRIGRRDMELVLIGNVGEDSIRTGEWDLQATLLERLEGLEIDPVVRLPMESASQIIRLLRGTLEGDDVEARYMAIPVVLQDPDLTSNLVDVRGWVAFAAGRFGDASLRWFETADASALNAPYALPRAAHAALLDRDEVSARRALDRLVATGVHGRAVDIDRTAIRAGLAALDGRHEDAAAGYRAAIAGWKELRVPWDEALTAMEWYRLAGAADRDARAAGDAARSILEGLGAVRILAILDSFSAGPDGPTAETAAVGGVDRAGVGREVRAAVD